MNRITIILLSLTLLLSCNGESNLVSLAKRNMPDLLDLEMRDYMGTVEKPAIRDLALVYDCDSLCVLQCRASAKDAYGEIQSETIRYIFVKDTFMSACGGKDTYCHLVQGAVYLDDEGIREFREKMEKDPHKQYLHYLSHSKPLELFR